MALKLPTLLEGEALVACLGISAKTRTKYPATKQALTNALKPTEFTACTEFQSRKLRPGENVHMYLHHLKRLLDAAMPELDEDSKNKILFQQFLAGVPNECSRILRANPDITTVDAAVTRAKLLLTVSVEKSALSVAAVTDAAKCTSEVRALQDSVKYLTEQMSTLMEKLQEQTFTAAPSSVPVRCYNCNRPGHLSRNCRQPRRQPVCYCSCNQPGHVARDCQPQENGLGITISRATGHSARV